MPAAKDMNQLYWDCNIEYNAYLLNCGGNVKVPLDYAEISAPMNFGRKCKDPEEETLSVLKNWWDEVKLKDLSTDSVIDSSTQSNFGVMANGATTGFACTYNKQCSDKLLCLYNKDAADPLYEKVTAPNQECATCQADCIHYLCPTKDYSPGESKLVDLSETVTFTGDVETSEPDFANMMNEAASKVVCSVTENQCLKQGFRVAVCQYNQILNDGDTVYTTGKPCSKRPSGTKCDNDLGGRLCVYYC
ncbi:hypothetical protein Aduo_000215 [Ancylostoma duodenale]